MPVSGIVLSCNAKCAEDGGFTNCCMDGVEVHGVLTRRAVLFAVVEADTVDGEVALVSDLNHVEGVISVGLAYHNFEDIQHER